jgi:hypothetical protein
VRIGTPLSAAAAGQPAVSMACKPIITSGIEEWCYVAGSPLDLLFGLDGHYVRIGPDPEHGLARIANQPYPNYEIAALSVLGLEFAYLARLGLRSASDKRISDTADLVDVMLARNVGTGAVRSVPDFLDGETCCRQRVGDLVPVAEAQGRVRGQRSAVRLEDERRAEGHELAADVMSVQASTRPTPGRSVRV